MANTRAAGKHARPAQGPKVALSSKATPSTERGSDTTKRTAKGGDRSGRGKKGIEAEDAAAAEDGLSKGTTWSAVRTPSAQVC